MIFTTAGFVAFAGLFFGLYAVVPARLRKPLVLLASYAFYGTWNVNFLALIGASTLVDYWVGLRLAAVSDEVRRRRLLFVSLAFNLGALAFFKYQGFFVASAADLARALGMSPNLPLLKLVLPVGISFYTFQTLSYTVDVYRRELEPTRSLLDFALYVAFFPQLVAGPIERAGRLLPQLQSLGRGASRCDWSGLAFVALGAFKKAVLADHFARIADAAYADPTTTYGPAMWIGTYAFTAQIYCDFSGYSDIAVGLARLMGVRLMQNFCAPYAATDPSDFWQRWHISLSTWLRDYLYIPLGGNRGSRARTMRNLMITMLLGGLWHGAAWNYVLWGAYHGLLLLAFGWLRDRAGGRAPLLLRRFVFFHLVCVGWALFRCGSLAQCGQVLGKLLGVSAFQWNEFLQGARVSGEAPYLASMGLVLLGMVALQHRFPVGSDRLVARLWRLPLPLRVGAVGLLLYASALLSPMRPPPFLYFQF